LGKVGTELASAAQRPKQSFCDKVHITLVRGVSSSTMNSVELYRVVLYCERKLQKADAGAKSDIQAKLERITSRWRTLYDSEMALLPP
jgi:hypothetical protein